MLESVDAGTTPPDSISMRSETGSRGKFSNLWTCLINPRWFGGTFVYSRIYLHALHLLLPTPNGSFRPLSDLSDLRAVDVTLLLLLLRVN
jgi:hypothetical protein